MQLEDKTKIPTEEARRKILDIISLLHGTPKLLDELCKKCDSKEVYCVHADLGGVDYYDNFWHVCLKCNSVLEHVEYYESFYCAGHTPKCPFCKQKTKNGT